MINKFENFSKLLSQIVNALESRCLTQEYAINITTLQCLHLKYANNKQISEGILGEFEVDYTGCIDPYIKVDKPVDYVQDAGFQQKLRYRIWDYLNNHKRDLNEEGINRRKRKIYLSNSHKKVMKNNSFKGKNGTMRKYSMELRGHRFRFPSLDVNAIYYSADDLLKSTLVKDEYDIENLGRAWEFAMLAVYEGMITPLRIQQSALTHTISKLTTFKKAVKKIEDKHFNDTWALQNYISINNIFGLLTEENFRDDFRKFWSAEFSEELANYYKNAKQKYLQSQV